MKNAKKFLLKNLGKQLTLIGILIFPNILFSQSLWKDSNPYSSGQNIKVGSIIKVIIKEGVKAQYSYESHKEDTHSIMANPDKKLNSEIRSFRSDRTIVLKNIGKTKSLDKIMGNLSVTVKQIETDTLVVEGSRSAVYDDSKCILTLTGKISVLDLKNGNTVLSDSVADLSLKYFSSPDKKQLSENEVTMKKETNDDGTVTERAELSDTEKQKLVLKYIKRMLGESE